MLQIQNLSISHARDLRPLVEGLSFALRPGDRAVVIGEEGGGKSTLLKLIYDESLVAGYAEYTGQILKKGLRLGYLPQELPPQDACRSAAAFCAAAEGFSRLTPRDLAETAAMLALPAALFTAQRPMHTLSGGEKVKLQLARLVWARPDVLLLDEPSNDLDIPTLAWLEGFIRQAPQPVLFVSHDETLIERTANVVIHLELLRRKTLPRCTVARLEYRAYVEQRLGKLAHQEQMAREEERAYRRQMDKYRQIESRVTHEQEAVSRQDPGSGRLLKKKMKTVKSMGRRFEREYEQRTRLPDVEEAILLDFSPEACLPAGKQVLSLALPELSAGGKTLARGVQLEVRAGEKVCIVGANGAGKTTLLQQAAAALLPRGDLRAAYMPQDYSALLPEGQTPVEFLCRSGSKDEISRVRTFLGSVKVTPEEMGHPLQALSGGQKAKLLFLKMILDGANVLLLDEPTRNFSPLSGPVVRAVLQRYRGTIISVSHDRRYIAEVCRACFVWMRTACTRCENLHIHAAGRVYCKQKTAGGKGFDQRCE